MLNDLVSIVIPVYNAEKWIKQCVLSCLDQKSPVEIIVIDDGSRDETRAELQPFLDRIVFKQIPHSGPQHARNMGLKIAQGAWIKFVDADDILERQTINKQVSKCKEMNAEFCYSDFSIINTDDNNCTVDLEYLIIGWLEDYSLWTIRGNCCQIGAILFKKSFLTNHQLTWNTELSVLQDNDFSLRAALTGCRYAYLPEITCYYRQHTGTRVSNAPIIKRIEASEIIFDNAYAVLSKNNQINKESKQVLCNEYFKIARISYKIDRVIFRRLIKKMLSINPDFIPQSQRYAKIVPLLGYQKTEAIAYQWHKVKNIWKH